MKKMGFLVVMLLGVFFATNVKADTESNCLEVACGRSVDHFNFVQTDSGYVGWNGMYSVDGGNITQIGSFNPNNDIYSNATWFENGLSFSHVLISADVFPWPVQPMDFAMKGNLTIYFKDKSCCTISDFRLGMTHDGDYWVIGSPNLAGFGSSELVYRINQKLTVHLYFCGGLSIASTAN